MMSSGESVGDPNITLVDALATIEDLSDPRPLLRRGLAAHAIMRSMIGIPAIYPPSSAQAATFVRTQRVTPVCGPRGGLVYVTAGITTAFVSLPAALRG